MKNFYDKVCFLCLYHAVKKIGNHLRVPEVKSIIIAKTSLIITETSCSYKTIEFKVSFLQQYIKRGKVLSGCTFWLSTRPVNCKEAATG